MLTQSGASTNVYIWDDANHYLGSAKPGWRLSDCFKCVETHSPERVLEQPAVRVAGSIHGMFVISITTAFFRFLLLAIFLFFILVVFAGLWQVALVQSLYCDQVRCAVPLNSAVALGPRN